MSSIPDARSNPWIASAMVIALSAACATTNPMRQARAAEQSEDFDLAVAHYARLVRSEPANREARLVAARSPLG